MKKLSFFALALFAMMPLLATLHVYLDANRFLDDSGITVIEVNYKIPYRDLLFNRTDQGFTADITIAVSLQQQGNTVYSFDPMPAKIILENEDMTKTDNGYLDKIVLPMKRDGYDLLVQITDTGSNESTSEVVPLPLLAPDGLISDLEMSAAIVADTSSYRARFIRGGMRFDVEPHHIFDNTRHSSFFIYFEIRNFGLDAQGVSDLSESVVVMRNGEEVETLSGKINKSSALINRIKEIQISDYEPGLYNIIMIVTDEITGKTMQVQDYFSVIEHSGHLTRMLNDLEKEFKLVQYFLPDVKKSTWDGLSEKGKRNFINRFWVSRDYEPSTTKNEFYDDIKERLAYTNQHFSFFSDGWESDRGRLYIKYGKPDETKKGETEFSLQSQSRDYIIWRYEGTRQTSYIFMDNSGTGNFRLIYSGKDETETTQPNYRDLLGENFDYDQLE
ncbi:MAG: GWxTD domain-containing protein [Candidatus Cloacimonetes bacterium]|nr:GWxTD domain-containing protein [Candidatus Cloacimonadota bacterium]